jgi:hypothetical protein
VEQLRRCAGLQRAGDYAAVGPRGGITAYRVSAGRKTGSPWSARRVSLTGEGAAVSNSGRPRRQAAEGGGGADHRRARTPRKRALSVTPVVDNPNRAYHTLGQICRGLLA